MVWIILKIILALLISAIPFIVKYYFVPKGKQNPKYRSSLSLAMSSMPFVKRTFAKLYLTLVNFLRKIEVSKNNRRFFQFAVLLVIMAVQVVNVNASQEAYQLDYSRELYCETFEGWPYKFNFFGLGYIATGISWNHVVPVYNLILMVMIFLLLSYRIFDKVVSKLHASKGFQTLVFSLSIILMFEPSGSLFMFAEFFILLFFASFLYPPVNGTKSIKYYSMKTIRVNREKSTTDSAKCDDK